jgi:hypothetical protein
MTASVVQRSEPANACPKYSELRSMPEGRPFHNMGTDNAAVARAPSNMVTCLMNRKCIDKRHAALELILTQTHTKCPPPRPQEAVPPSAGSLACPNTRQGPTYKIIPGGGNLLTATMLDWDILMEMLFICVLFRPENGGSILLRNSDNYLSIFTL